MIALILLLCAGVVFALVRNELAQSEAGVREQALKDKLARTEGELREAHRELAALRASAPREVSGLPAVSAVPAASAIPAASSIPAAMEVPTASLVPDATTAVATSVLAVAIAVADARESHETAATVAPPRVPGANPADAAAVVEALPIFETSASVAGAAGAIHAEQSALAEAARAARDAERIAAQAAAQAATELRERRSKQWRETVRPFLAENVVWFIGGFLVIAGSLYFVREAWNVVAAVGRHLLLVGVALAYAAAFVGVGVWFRRKHNLTAPGRAMAFVGLSLLPVAMLAAADAWSSSIVAWALLSLSVLGCAYPIAYLASGLLERALARPLAVGSVGMMALLGATPAAAALSPALSLLLPYAGWLVAHSAARAPLAKSDVPGTTAFAFHLAGLAYGLAFVLGVSRAMVPDAGLSWTAAMGPLAVLLAFSALHLDVELRARRGEEPTLDATLTIALCCGVAGVAATVGSPPLFALSTALLAALFAVGIHWLRIRLLLVFALTLAGASLAALFVEGGPFPWMVSALIALMSLVPSVHAATPQTGALFLLPLPWLAALLADRFERRAELALARDARIWSRLALVAICILALAQPDVRAGLPTLVGATGLLWLWYRAHKTTVAAWCVALAGGVSLALAAALRFETPVALWCATVALCAAGAVAAWRRGSRPVAAALLELGQLTSLLALASALETIPDVEVSLLAPWLALAVAAWTASALLHASLEMGAAAILGALALAWNALFAWNLPALGAIQIRILAMPLGLVLLVWLGRTGAGRVRIPPPLPMPLGRLLPRARGVHAISEAALLFAWPSLVAVAMLALASIGHGASEDLRAAIVLSAVALLAGALAPFTRASIGAHFATLTLGAAGAAAASAALSPFAPSAWPGSLALGAVAAGVAASRAWSLLPTRARTAPVHASGAAAALIVHGLAALAALLGCVPFLLPLIASTLPLPSFPATAGVVAAIALTSASFALHRRLINRAGASLWLHTALAVALAAATDALVSPIWIAAALQTFALVNLGRAWLAQKRDGSVAPPPSELRDFATACAAVAFSASLLPLDAPFASWPHSAADALLLAFIGASLATGRGPIFLHLLFAAVALGGTRARLILGLPSEGHVLVLGAAALLALGIGLRRRPPYARAAFQWSLAAAAGGLIRFACLFPLAPRLDGSWPWALAAALVAVPIAPRLWPAVASRFAVGGTTIAALLAVWTLAPDWFVASGWFLTTALLGLGWAALALVLDRAGERAALFLDRASLALSLRRASPILLAAPALLSLIAAMAVLVRIDGPALASPQQSALLLALTTAGGALLLLEREASRSRALDVCAAGLPLALTVLASGLFAELAVAPVLLLLTVALAYGVISRRAGAAPRWRATSLFFWSLAAASTHAQIGEWSTALVPLALAFLLPLSALPPQVAELAPRTFAILSSCALALAFAGEHSEFAAALGLLAPMGALTVVAAWLHRLRATSAAAMRLLAATAFLLLVLGALFTTTLPTALAVLGGGLLLSALLVDRAIAREPHSLDAALAIAALLWFFARNSPLPMPLPADADPALALAAAALLLVGERAVRPRREDLARSLLLATVVLPLAALPLAALRGVALTPIAFCAAVIFGLIAWMHRSTRAARMAALVAIALGDVALFSLWAAQGLSSLQLYTIPLGFSLGTAAQLARGDLSRSNLQIVRGAACLILYAGTAMQMIDSGGVVLPLLLGLLALCTVAAGALLRVRAFLFAGTAALVVDVLGNLVRASVGSTMTLAIIATTVGLSIMVGMAWFSVRRAQATALYRRFNAAIEDWE